MTFWPGSAAPWLLSPDVVGVLHHERLAHEDILSAIRSQGYHDLKEVDAIILEANGGISVLAKKQETAFRV